MLKICETVPLRMNTEVKRAKRHRNERWKNRDTFQNCISVFRYSTTLIHYIVTVRAKQMFAKRGVCPVA